MVSQHNPAVSGVPRHDVARCGATVKDSRSAHSFGYVVHKTEKLTTALYLVTDIMTEKEPMKWKARESAVDLLSDITLISSLSVSEKMTTLRNTAKKVEKIIAFLDIARSAHLMSEMNASVLKKEYCVLKDNLEEEWNRVYEKSKSIFSDSFFDVPHALAQNLSKDDVVYNSRGKLVRGLQSGEINPSPTPVSPPASVDRVDGRQTSSFSSNHGDSAQVSSGKSSRSEVAEIAPSHTSIGQTDTGGHVLLAQGRGLFLSGQREASRATASGRHGEVHTLAQDGFGRDDRRKIILALIKQKPALTVKDIAKSIPHISEKTIQRELFSMVIEGTLRKRGERRWSTYSLQKNI